MNSLLIHKMSSIVRPTASLIRGRQLFYRSLSSPLCPSGSSRGFASNETDGNMNKFLPGTQSLLEQFRVNASPEEEESPSIRVDRRRALSKAITLIESKLERDRQEANKLLNNFLPLQGNPGFRLGIAGPPGAGKSTLIERFGLWLLETKSVDEKIAVLCIDPSSSVTGGSILGDKTRMVELSRHDRAFVRPTATGGALGGLHLNTVEATLLCQAANYNFVIVETVGLGQSEIEVEQTVDMLLLVLPPAGGDELQGVKKGILEVADLIAVNKADGDLLQAARRTAVEYKGATQFRPTSVPVLLISAHTSEGFEKLWETIVEFRRAAEQDGSLEERRKSQATYWMWKHLSMLIDEHKDTVLKQKAAEIQQDLRDYKMTSRTAASELFQLLFDKIPPS